MGIKLCSLALQLMVIPFCYLLAFNLFVFSHSALVPTDLWCKNNVYMQLMALIGEQFDESEEICGVVASVRQRQDKLALWTKTATNEAVQVLIFFI